MSKKKSFTDEQKQIARLAKALGHPVRVAIVQMLLTQECCYHGDMSEVIPVAKSTLSQHLSELKDAGIIQGTITPPMIKYCINKEKWALVKSLFGNLFETNAVFCESCEV
jgi:predicted transcriptional regulator